MFRSSHVITAATLRKRFSEISRELEYQPAAVLITQRRRSKLVLVNAEIFEDLLDYRHNARRDDLSSKDPKDPKFVD